MAYQTLGGNLQSFAHPGIKHLMVRVRLRREGVKHHGPRFAISHGGESENILALAGGYRGRQVQVENGLFNVLKLSGRIDKRIRADVAAVFKSRMCGIFGFQRSISHLHGMPNNSPTITALRQCSKTPCAVGALRSESIISSTVVWIAAVRIALPLARSLNSFHQAMASMLPALGFSALRCRMLGRVGASSGITAKRLENSRGSSSIQSSALPMRIDSLGCSVHRRPNQCANSAGTAW